MKKRSRMFLRLKTFLPHVLLFPVALILLFEEWGWVPLAAFFNRIARTILFWRKIEVWITRLSPRVSFCILLIPMLTLLPMKFLGLYFIELGHIASGVGVIMISKVAGTAFFARLFALTLPKLLRLNWFAKYYPRWVNWKNSLLFYVRGSWPFKFAHQTFLKLKLKARKYFPELHSS